MGVYYNGKKLGQPYFNGKKMNCYHNGKKLWSGSYNEFIPESKGTYDLIYAGLDIDNAPTDVEADIVAYQVIGWENPRSIDYLKIPSEHNGKPVTELYELASSLSEEITIDNLLIGSNVERVHSAVLPLGDIVSVINYAYFPTTITKLNHNATNTGMNLNIKHIYFNCISAEVEYSTAKTDSYSPWELRSSAMTTVTIGKDVARLREGLFYNETIVSVYSERETTCHTIGTDAFSGCSSLASIIIPESVTSIGERAFVSCSSLASITLPTNLTSIGNYAFSGCSSLASIIIPESVTSIGNYAFANCIALTEIIIPEKVTSIGDNAFRDCSSLASIIIPESVTSIGDGAFYGCSALTDINIPDAITSIEDNTFRGCSALTTIDMPTQVETIGNNAFRDCSSLASITLPTNLTSIKNYAFYKCSSLASITLPTNLTSIGNYAFANCIALTEIIIPESVTSIISTAFSGCTLLAIIIIDNQTIADTQTNIGKLFTNAQTVYVLSGLTVGSYIATNFEYQETSDKEGYKKYIKGEV